jgi:tetratricopeptide (TPR) repeat protein
LDLLDWSGRAALEAEHPVLARDLYRQLLAESPGDRRGLHGLGRTWLLLGRAFEARCYAEALIETLPDDTDAHELLVRSLLLGLDHQASLDAAERAMRLVSTPTAGLHAAHGSALFRMRRNLEAASAYRLALGSDPNHAEAHLRLGSGLSGSSGRELPPQVAQAAGWITTGEVDLAIACLQSQVAQPSPHPVAQRLLGEALLERKLRGAWLLHSDAAWELDRLLPDPVLDHGFLAAFFPGYGKLRPTQQRTVRRASALLVSDLRRVLTMGGSHDFLLLDQRTTDSHKRAPLRGQLTFDGRLWDDVRGIGGLDAATGIEALDGPPQLCFDTLAHELAHQAHLFSFTRADRNRVRRLFLSAQAENRLLDYYAGANETEYLAQGLEAFAALAKRPGRQITHGHTRFELHRRDPELYRFLEAKVDHDPLREVSVRDRLLRAAIELAWLAGRPEDALTAASWLSSDEVTKLRERAQRAVLLDRSY